MIRFFGFFDVATWGVLDNPPVLSEESLALQVHRRELMEAVEAAREPLGFPSVMAMVQDCLLLSSVQNGWLMTRGSPLGNLALC